MDQGHVSHGEPSAAGESPSDDDSSRGPDYSCRICLDTASEAVVSRCGHLFCWPCIHRWMATARGNECPVCKAGISADNVIPLYLGGKTAEANDPRKRTPPRPQGERPQPNPEHPGNAGMFGGQGNGFHFSFGVGAFPFFGLYATNFGNPFGQQAPQQHAHGNNVQAQNESLAQRMFLILGVMCVLWLLL